MLLEQQISILEWFLKKKKTGVIMLKIQLCHHRNKLHFKIYSNRKQFFEFVITFTNITVFTVFLINKCSLGEQEWLCPNFWQVLLSVWQKGQEFKLHLNLNISWMRGIKMSLFNESFDQIHKTDWFSSWVHLTDSILQCINILLSFSFLFHIRK